MKTGALILAAWLSLSAAALADAKVVANITTDNFLGTKKQTVTLYFQNSMARVESTDGRVVLYDLAAGKRWWLDPAHHTYSVLGLGEWLPPDTAKSRWQARFQSTSKPDVQVKGDASHPTFKVSEEVSGVQGVGNWGAMTDDRLPGSGPQMTTSMPGLPVGGMGDGTDDVAPTPVTLQGEYWRQGNVPSPPVNWLPWYIETVPQGADTAPLVPLLMARLGAAAPPVRSTVTFTRGQEQMVMKTELQSVSQEPLDRSLFLVPDGYRQVYPIPMQ